MVARHHCCVPGCTNDSRYDTEKKLSFHRFPHDIIQRRAWIAKIRRDVDKDFKFKISGETRVCSAHFRAEDYLRKSLAGLIRLKPEAVPSIFDWTKTTFDRRGSRRHYSIDVTPAGGCSSAAGDMIDQESGCRRYLVIPKTKTVTARHDTACTTAMNGGKYLVIPRNQKRTGNAKCATYSSGRTKRHSASDDKESLVEGHLASSSRTNCSDAGCIETTQASGPYPVFCEARPESASSVLQTATKTTLSDRQNRPITPAANHDALIPHSNQEINTMYDTGRYDIDNNIKPEKLVHNNDGKGALYENDSNCKDSRVVPEKSVSSHTSAGHNNVVMPNSDEETDSADEDESNCVDNCGSGVLAHCDMLQDVTDICDHNYALPGFTGDLPSCTSGRSRSKGSCSQTKELELVYRFPKQVVQMDHSYLKRPGVSLNGLSVADDGGSNKLSVSKPLRWIVKP